MSKSRSILVLFGEALAAPEACYSLVDGGFDVVVACRRGSSCSLRKSRLVEARDVAVPEVDFETTISDLCNLAQEINAVAILPLDDGSLWITNDARDRLPCPVAIAGIDAVNVAIDKRLQINAARDAGFALPLTEFSNGSSITEEWKTYPCILKGALATRLNGGGIGRSRASFCSDAADVEDALTGLDQVEPMVLQEWKTGNGVGVFGFRTDDGVQAWSGHHRVRMMNPAGSGSSCCESEFPSVETQARVERMLESIGWNGLFMIELLRDADGTEWFMELNGRAWGSMALARAFGLEYPLWEVLDSLNELPELPETSEMEVRRARHLGRELVHLLLVLRGRSRRDGMPWPKRIRTITALCSRRSTDRWYNARRGDMKVFYADALECIHSRVFRGGRT